MSARIPIWAADGAIRTWAIVDDADFEWLNQWRWCLGTKGYAIRRGRKTAGEPRTTFRMSRQITGLERGDSRQVDHINGNRLDNRRSNLRIVSGTAANMQNIRGAYRGAASRFRGVCYRAPKTANQRPKWTASARLNGKLHHLGTHATEEAAAQAAAAWRAANMPFSAEAATS